MQLKQKKGAQVDELSGVLQVYGITHKTTMGEISFTLAFGHEAIMAVKISMSTH